MLSDLAECDDVQDAIQVVNGGLRRALVSVSTPRKEDADEPHNPDIIQRMRCQFEYEAAASSGDGAPKLYGGGVVDEIVKAYQVEGVEPPLVWSHFCQRGVCVHKPRRVHSETVLGRATRCYVLDSGGRDPLGRGFTFAGWWAPGHVGGR